jgi:hypothetical protein
MTTTLILADGSRVEREGIPETMTVHVRYVRRQRIPGDVANRVSARPAFGPAGYILRSGIPMQLQEACSLVAPSPSERSGGGGKGDTV